MNFESIKQDFIERFANFETVKGVYLLPAGLAGLWVVTYHLQFILQVFGLACFGYMAIEGVRKIGVNRIKQALKAEERKIRRKIRNDIK